MIVLSPIEKRHKPHQFPTIQLKRAATWLDWLALIPSDLTGRINTLNIKRSPGISLSRVYIITKNRCYGKSLCLKPLQLWAEFQRLSQLTMCTFVKQQCRPHLADWGLYNVCFTNEFYACFAKSASLFGHIHANFTPKENSSTLQRRGIKRTRSLSRGAHLEH